MYVIGAGHKAFFSGFQAGCVESATSPAIANRTDENGFGDSSVYKCERRLRFAILLIDAWAAGAHSTPKEVAGI
jgi:hypothetical protein